MEKLDHGCAEAQDVAREHPEPSRAVEGRAPRACQCHGEWPAAQGATAVAEGRPAGSDRFRQALTRRAEHPASFPARLSGHSQALRRDCRPCGYLSLTTIARCASPCADPLLSTVTRCR